MRITYIDSTKYIKKHKRNTSLDFNSKKIKNKYIMIKKLNSYLIITQFEDLSLKDFRKHILYLYNNNILYDLLLPIISIVPDDDDS